MENDAPTTIKICKLMGARLFCLALCGMVSDKHCNKLPGLGHGLQRMFNSIKKCVHKPCQRKVESLYILGTPLTLPFSCWFFEELTLASVRKNYKIKCTLFIRKAKHSLNTFCVFTVNRTHVLMLYKNPPLKCNVVEIWGKHSNTFQDVCTCHQQWGATIILENANHSSK